MADSTRQVTVLTHSNALLTKRWFLDDKGKPKSDDYGFAKTFDVQTIDVENFSDLCELLDVLKDEPHRCVIRGALLPGRATTNVLRRKNASKGEKAFFGETPRHWVMLDVDLKDPEIRCAYHTAEGCLAAVNAAISRLPFELRTAGCWWQLSSSAGFKPGLRVHLWFWLDRPVGEGELTRWAEYANEAAGKLIVDPAVFRTVQPNYTANPIFDHVVDPVAQRTGVIAGPPVSFPRLNTRNDAWRRKLDALRNPQNDHLYTHVRDACAAYFCAHGPEADDKPLFLALRTAIDHSCSIRNVTDSKYDDAKLRSFIDGGKDFAKDRAVAGENIVLASDGTPKACVGNANALLKSSPAFTDLVAYNRRALQIELLREPPWGGGAPRQWTDADSVELAEWFMREHRMTIDDGPAYRALLTLARQKSFDPVEDYLVALTPTGNASILDTWLIDWCGAPDTSYVRKVSRLWAISCVARALQPGAQVDTVLVLQGLTGRRKTSLFRALAGKFYAAVIDDKDLVQKIHGPWIIEFPELGPFKHTDVNKIKGFVDQKFDRFRTPYARVPEDKPRGCVIVATTNESGWQEDATSARRFWPVDIRDVDIEKVLAGRDELWAQAVVAFRAGEPWWVEAEDPDFVEAQETQYAHDPWQDLIGQALEHGRTGWGVGGDPVEIPPRAKSIKTWTLFVAIFGDLKQSKRDQHRLAKCMRKLGWEQDGENGWTKTTGLV